MAFLTTFRLINTTFVDQQHLSFRFVVCLKNSEKWLLSICKVLCLFRQKGIQCHKQEEHRRRHRHSTGFEGLEFELKNELPAAATASCGVQEEEDLPSSSVIIGIDFLSMQFSRTFDKRSNRLETSSSAKKGLVQPPCAASVEI